MDINDRFRSALSSIELQLARSLPVFSGGKEVLFFYPTVDVSKTEYKIPEIRYVVFRDIKSGDTTVSSGADALPADILASVTESVNSYSLPVEEEIDAEDEYMELYENLFASIGSDSDDCKQADKLSALFTKLTEETALVPIYRFLGKDFFDLISAK